MEQRQLLAQVVRVRLPMLGSNSATGSSITGLAAGTYTVTATDSSGCTDTDTVTITRAYRIIASWIFYQRKL